MTNRQYLKQSANKLEAMNTDDTTHNEAIDELNKIAGELRTLGVYDQPVDLRTRSNVSDCLVKAHLTTLEQNND